MLKRVLFACPGLIQKSAPRADGSPVIRLHCSGTRRDVTGDRVEAGLLESMLEQAKAGTVKLLENHNATFPLGYSFDGEIVTLPGEAGKPESRELFVDFWLDTSNPLTAAILNQLDAGYAAQCSIGINDSPKTETRVDPEAGTITRYLLSGKFDHVAFTRPGEAAYQYADIAGVRVAKSLAEAETILKEARASGKGATMPDEIKGKLAALKAMREKAKAGDFAKDDTLTACKTAVEHCKAIKEVGDAMAADAGATPEDLRAVLADLMAEVEAMEAALASHVATPAPEAHSPEMEAAKADEAGAVEAAKVAAPAPPAAIPAATTKMDEENKAPIAPPHIGPPLPGPGPGPIPAPGPGPAPSPAASGAGGASAPTSGAVAAPGIAITPEDPEKATKADEVEAAKPSAMEAELKSLKDGVAKLLEINKALTDRMAKVEAAPDYRRAPARYLTASGDSAPDASGVFNGLGARERDTYSRHAAADALAQVIGGKRR